MSDIQPWLRQILRCPVCRAELTDVTGPDGGAALRCATDCEKPGQRREYRIEDGIPVMLVEEARIVSA
ncbi:Trm112 family protein [Dermacoccaceae bacterium W4C1]